MANVDQREQRVVIAGAGLAGTRTAVLLREAGFTGTITVAGAERHRPYDRPPLSKDVLLGTAEGAPLDVDFDALGIELLLGRTATGIDATARTLLTDAGPLPYDRLVIATGAEALTLPGSAGMPGVHVLRTLDDAARLRPLLAARGSLIAVGAGWI
ncbi:FAD-dependent oxidoreductase, partial [Streptomyces harbinensis]|uniref:FAD-dependent oxidoreductase n=1 Tax=Streptomyces harbinensis TaxID=1176198 RepID=UPI0034DF1E25